MNVVGRPSDERGRLVVIDLQGLSDTAKQVISALISSEILRAASSKTDRIPTRTKNIMLFQISKYA